MFREFNVKFEDVEMLGGADNLLEGTEITKVIVRGDNNKMSSLDSMLKNCNELDTVEGELDLNGVGDIDNLLEGTELVKSINLKNINNENISANNSFPYVESINIGGEVYDKRAMQNVIASKDWTFDNITYSGDVGENLLAKSATMIDDDKTTIKNTLEQKARGFEVIGQTYENLINGKGEAILLDELSMESVEGKPNEFSPHLEQPVCVEVIEGQTYQNLIDGKEEQVLINEFTYTVNDFNNAEFEPPRDQKICIESIEGETYQNLIEGKGEYKLTDTFSTTWTGSNNSIENPPSIIEIPEIWGNTVQGYANHLTAQNFVDMIKGTQYGNPSVVGEREVKFNTNPGGWYATSLTEGMNSNPETYCGYTLKPNTTYTFVTYPWGSFNIGTPTLSYREYDTPVKPCRSFTTDDTGRVIIRPVSPFQPNGLTVKMLLIEGEVYCDNVDFDLNYIQSVGDLYVDESGEPILDEEGNEQYKLDIRSENINLNRNDIEYVLPYGGYPEVKLDNTAFKPNTTYEIVIKVISNTLDAEFRDYSATYVSILSGVYIAIPGVGTTGEFRGLKVCSDDTSRINNYTFRFDTYKSTKGEARVRIAIYERDSLSDTPYIPHEEDKTTILMPHQLKKIGSIKHYHQSTGDKWYPACSKLYYDYNAQKFFMKHVPTVEHDILNVLTTMNPNVNFDTRSYNSEDYYAISINFNVNNNKFEVLGTGGTDDITFMVKTNYPLPLLTGRESSMNWGTSNTTKLEGYVFGYVAQYSQGWTFTLIIKASNFGDRTLDKSGVIDFFTTYPTSFVALKNQNYTIYLETLDDVYDILETKILEKPSLDAYSPKTYLTSNSEIQPSQMTVTNKEVKFMPLSLQPSKSYTVQLDSVGKDNKAITVNLGGTTTTIQPTNDTSKHHRVSVTTPSSLTTDNLELNGEGVIVNDVMLFEGNTSVIKQDVDYIDDIQSIGEPYLCKNIFPPNIVFTKDRTLLNDGTLYSGTTTDYATEDYILCDLDVNEVYSISSQFTYTKVAFYDVSNKFIKIVNSNTNTYIDGFSIPSNAKYYRISVNNSAGSEVKIQLEKGNTHTSYEEYFEGIRYKLEIQTYDSTWDKL